MSIAMRLKVMSFLQYFIWGSWLVTLGSYMINTLHFTGANVGMVYSSKGIEPPRESWRLNFLRKR